MAVSTSFGVVTLELYIIVAHKISFGSPPPVLHRGLDKANQAHLHLGPVPVTVRRTQNSSLAESRIWLGPLITFKPNSFFVSQDWFAELLVSFHCPIQRLTWVIGLKEYFTIDRYCFDIFARLYFISKKKREFCFGNIQCYLCLWLISPKSKSSNLPSNILFDNKLHERVLVS